MPLHLSVPVMDQSQSQTYLLRSSYLSKNTRNNLRSIHDQRQSINLPSGDLVRGGCYIFDTLNIKCQAIFAWHCDMIVILQYSYTE